MGYIILYPLAGIVNNLNDAVRLVVEICLLIRKIITAFI